MRVVETVLTVREGAAVDEGSMVTEPVDVGLVDDEPLDVALV